MNVKNYMKDIYEYAIKNLPRTTLLEAVNNVFEGKPIITNLDWKYKPYRFFYIKEEFDNTPSEKDMKEAHAIYIMLRNFILNAITKEERDIIALYIVYGDLAEFKYNVDQERVSDFNKILENNKCTIKTKYGSLDFKFVNREIYNVSDETLAGYDTDEKCIVIFLDDFDNIKTVDLINILRKRDRFIHELSHYIDDINENLSKIKYGNSKDEQIKYINDPSEFKANSQEMVYCFGGYLFKNQNEITNKYNLMNKKDIKTLFDLFLYYYSQRNVLQADDLARFQTYIKYWKPENREKFYDFLYKTISDTQNKIDYTESERRNNMLKLLKLEETFLEIGD